LKLNAVIFFSVIDDENPTVYTAGAIVTVTVTLIRQNMSVLFGDESVTDKHEEQDASSPIKGEEEEEDVKKETVVNKGLMLHIVISASYSFELHRCGVSLVL
jgi:effector-binding domain-containing protein